MSTQTNTSLDDLRKTAKRLKKAYARGDADAITRFRMFIDAERPLKHADFLHVIAKEAGHESWPKLKFATESATMSFEQRADRLKVALYEGQHWMTDRLLADDPNLQHANFGLQVALYDIEAVRRVLANDPKASVRMVGVRAPVLHLAFSNEIHRTPSKRNDMLEIANLLVTHGADVDDGYPATPGEDHKLSALYGALCHADNFELGRWLLENGANPNDNESLYHSTELGHTRALKSLLKHGAKPDGTNALPRALDFNDLEKVRLLLEAGADPNITVPDHPSGQPMNTIPALHQAVRRGRSAETIKLLLKFGANPNAVWQGHSTYAMARIFGNGQAAMALEKLGHAGPLSANEQILANCADGRPGPARLDIKVLGQEDRYLLTRLAAEPGWLTHMKALIAAGLDPNETNEMGLTPLQIAGWNGLADELSFFLTLEPDLTHKNRYGGDALDTVLHGSTFAPKRAEANHIECARRLLEAGSIIYPQFITGCGNEDMAAFLEEWAAAHPENVQS